MWSGVIYGDKANRRAAIMGAKVLVWLMEHEVAMSPMYVIIIVFDEAI